MGTSHLTICIVFQIFYHLGWFLSSGVTRLWHSLCTFWFCASVGRREQCGEFASPEMSCSHRSFGFSRCGKYYWMEQYKTETDSCGLHAADVIFRDCYKAFRKQQYFGISHPLDSVCITLLCYIAACLCLQQWLIYQKVFFAVSFL